MPIAALVNLITRRGLDPGKPPFHREALTALLLSDDSGDPVPIADAGVRSGYVQTTKAQITLVNAWNEHDRFCLCGCGGKLRTKGARFLMGHQKHLKEMEERIEQGLLDPADLPPSVIKDLDAQSTQRYFWKKRKVNDESTKDARNSRPRPRVLDQWTREESEEDDPQA